MKKKALSIIISVCLIISVVTGLSIPASAATNTVKKRALVISAHLNDGDYAPIKYTHENMRNALSNICSTTASYFYDANNPNPPSLSAIINSVFKNSDSDDINYLYILCHGTLDGKLVIDGGIYLSELRQILDGVDGHFVFFLESCYSGNAIQDQSDEDEDMSLKLLEQFFYGGNQTDGIFDGNNKYTVFCSSQKTEPSWSLSYTFASYAWALGMGYDMAKQHPIGYWQADINSDKVITAKEMHDFSYPIIRDMAKDFDLIQNSCYYSYYYFYSAIYEDFPLGDANMDYTINSKDSLMLRQYLADIIEFDDPRQLELSDLNGDGLVNAKDSLLLQQYIADVSVPEEVDLVSEIE